ncbi:MFS transporter [Xanthomonas arboricola]|nr:MFS transporter [Xanthomonas arboricola]
MPVAALLALAMTGFICIVTETLPAGLLPQMSAGLGISPALAGQTVTAYALGSVIAAIPLTIATQQWRRRNVLLLTIVGFLLFNSVTALSTSYALTLAMAIAMVGTPVALSLGVPLGTWMGGLLGWRSAFAAMSGLTLILIVWVLLKVPDYPGQSAAQRVPLRKVLGTPGVRPVLATVMAWMLAHNILYTYVAPFAAHAGLAHRVDVLLLIFGVAALVGIGVAAKLVEQHLRGTVLVSLATFLAISVVLALLQDVQLVVYVCVAVWGLTFGGAATLLQTALADSAGEGADVALSLNVVAWNSVIAGGGVVGGVLLDRWGAQTFPIAMALLLAIGLLIAWRARQHGFAAGARSPVAGH